MMVNISENMRACLEQCVKFAINKNAWISTIDHTTDEEVTMEEALEFLKECKE
jgi:hypothetical protein